MQTTVYGNSHTGPREAGLSSQELRLSENRRAGGAFEKPYEVKKTQPEEPNKKEIKFVCKAGHCETAMQSRRKTQTGHPNVVSQSIGFFATRTQAYALGQRFQEFMQTAEECVAEAHGHPEHEHARYDGRSAGVRFRLHTVSGLCTKTPCNQTMPQQARKLLGNDRSTHHRLDQIVPTGARR